VSTTTISGITRAARRRPVVVALVVAVLLFGAGLFVGLRLPLGTKNPTVLNGVAMRANSENDLVMFDADNGQQVAFGADSIWWESQGTSGDGDPPCLREPQEKVPVRVGVVRVSTPSGGSFLKAVWVQCP